MTHLSFLVIVLLSALQQVPPPAGQTPPAQANETETPADYVIGSEDVLGVVFWREPELSGDVTVRPDGKISLPVIGEIEAAGMTPANLQARILKAASKYVTDPNVAVVVRTINSRKVFVTGQVKTPGGHALTGPLTVLQAIAMAGGLNEFADEKNVRIIRTVNGAVQSFKFNYRDVSRGKNLEQNLLLKPGDTVVVP